MENVGYINLCIELSSGKVMVDGPRHWNPAHLRLMQPYVKKSDQEQRFAAMMAALVDANQQQRREMDMMREQHRMVQAQVMALTMAPLPVLAAAPAPTQGQQQLQDVPEPAMLQLLPPPAPTPSMTPPGALGSPAPPSPPPTPGPPPVSDSPAANTRGALLRLRTRNMQEEVEASGFTLSVPHCPICLRAWDAVALRTTFLCGHRICGRCSEQDDWAFCPVCRGCTEGRDNWTWGEM